MHNPNAPAPPVRTVWTIGPMLGFIGVGCLGLGVLFACLPASEATGYAAVSFGVTALSIICYLSCICGWCRPQSYTTVNNYGDMSNVPLVMPGVMPGILPHPYMMNPTQAQNTFVNTSSVYV